jgi:hypothetical protein
MTEYLGKKKIIKNLIIKIMKNILRKVLPTFMAVVMIMSACIWSSCKRNTFLIDEKPSQNPVSTKSVKAASVDLRQWQHGLDLVKLNSGNYYLIWSSGGNPPAGTWTHDIYYSTINPANPTITPLNWISANEAQEPASSAINASGTKILCTWEDGNNAANTVAQRYFLSSSTLGGTSTTNYANAGIYLDGGHSGHVASVGDYFVSTWVEGWIDGGGVDNLGSGDIVYVSVVNPSGTLSANNVLVTSGRQWWSEIAGSPTKALIIWQGFISGQQYADLKMMIYDPATGAKGSIQTIMNNVLYYHYSVKYIPSIDRFLIMASKDGGAGANSGRLCSGGKAFLVDNNGNITASKDLTNGVIRESQSIINGNRIVQTQLKNGQSLFGNNSTGGTLGGIMVLDLTATSINVAQTIDDSYLWEYMGNDGFFQNANTVVIFSLAKVGLQTKTYTINGGGTTYNITASAGTNGTISPSGTVSVAQGASQTFTITPNTNYVVNAVTVDGVSQGAISSYTYTNVQAPHTINATFKPVNTSVNLSQGKIATSSSYETPATKAPKAVDGKTKTRWASIDPATTNQWLKVDLGSSKTITKVVLNWEDSYAKSFQIQTSNNNSTWTTIYSTTNGSGGNITLDGLSGSGRYIRIYCTERGTEWGYSLWEFQAWGY